MITSNRFISSLDYTVSVFFCKGWDIIFYIFLLPHEQGSVLPCNRPQQVLPSFAVTGGKGCDFRERPQAMLGLLDTATVGRSASSVKPGFVSPISMRPRHDSLSETSNEGRAFNDARHEVGSILAAWYCLHLSGLFAVCVSPTPHALRDGGAPFIGVHAFA